MSLPLLIDVEGCRACPAATEDRHCTLADGEINYAEPTPPDWCPLRNGNVTLRLVEKK